MFQKLASPRPSTGSAETVSSITYVKQWALFISCEGRFDTTNGKEGRIYDKSIVDVHQGEARTALAVESRALWLLVHLGQPFGAFLLAQQRSGEYKRIASDHYVIGQEWRVTDFLTEQQGGTTTNNQSRGINSHHVEVRFTISKPRRKDTIFQRTTTVHQMSKTTLMSGKVNGHAGWIITATSRSHAGDFEAKGQMQHFPKIDNAFNGRARINHNIQAKIKSPYLSRAQGCVNLSKRHI
ncbi:hypothetical protein F4604DRAFT_1905366 [Suillus subluteus]|nr:hypothetical protein F4604DRAFT_1905366 [Suillus subluteus]